MENIPMVYLIIGFAITGVSFAIVGVIVKIFRSQLPSHIGDDVGFTVLLPAGLSGLIYALLEILITYWGYQANPSVAAIIVVASVCVGPVLILLFVKNSPSRPI